MKNRAICRWHVLFLPIVSHDLRKSEQSANEIMQKWNAKLGNAYQQYIWLKFNRSPLNIMVQEDLWIPGPSSSKLYTVVKFYPVDKLYRTICICPVVIIYPLYKCIEQLGPDIPFDPYFERECWHIDISDLVFFRWWSTCQEENKHKERTWPKCNLYETQKVEKWRFS